MGSLRALTACGNVTNVSRATVPQEEFPMRKPDLDTPKAVSVLNRILEAELAGVVRYTHWSLMVFGTTRIPVVSWLREQADESLGHAQRAGELITHLGAHPSLAIGALLETQKHSVQEILQESRETERAALALYQELFDVARDRSILVEEYARELIAQEELHLGEVDKMLRKPGELGAAG